METENTQPEEKAIELDVTGPNILWWASVIACWLVGLITWLTHTYIRSTWNFLWYSPVGYIGVAAILGACAGGCLLLSGEKKLSRRQAWCAATFWFVLTVCAVLTTGRAVMVYRSCPPNTAPRILVIVGGATVYAEDQLGRPIPFRVDLPLGGVWHWMLENLDFLVVFKALVLIALIALLTYMGRIKEWKYSS